MSPHHDRIAADPSTGMVMIPPGTQAWTLSVALWDKWEVQLKDFFLGALAGVSDVRDSPDPSRCDAVLPVHVALVPQEDNDYNPDAIQICPAPDGPGRAPGAAIGYMRESHLYHYSSAIHRLDDLSENPVGCHGWIELDRYEDDEEDDEEDEVDGCLTRGEARELGWWVSGVRLNLPTGDETDALVAAYAGQNPPRRGSTSYEAGTQMQVAEWAEWASRPHELGRLRGITSSVFGLATTWIVNEAGVRVGRYEPAIGTATLVDERAREDAHAALQAHGVAITAREDLTELEAFARATVEATRHSWEILEVRDGYPVANLPVIAHFDPGLRVLSVWARAHIEPIKALLRRHDVDVAQVVWTTPPHDVRVYNEQSRPVAPTGLDSARRLRLRPELRRLLPPEHMQWLGATWKQAPRHTQDEQREVPVWSSAGYPGRCGLCGVLAFGLTPALTFCDDCTHSAFSGLLRDTGSDGDWTETSIWALRRLSEIEFSGPPSLLQLGNLPTCAPEAVNEAMLLRLLIPRPGSALPLVGAQRGPRTWEQWLESADLLTGLRRPSRGTWVTATDGHLCRSMFERTIDDFLHHHRIDHEPEPHYPWHPELNTTGLRADWLLADGTFVEALGMMEDSAYAEKVTRKVTLATSAGITLLTLTPRDVGRLNEVFATWLGAGPIDPGAVRGRGRR